MKTTTRLKAKEIHPIVGMRLGHELTGKIGVFHSFQIPDIQSK